MIFAIRTRRIPFFRSHPSLPLVLSALAIVVVGSVLPSTPFAHTLGFQALPAAFFAALAGMVVGYLVLIEFGKHFFYRAQQAVPGPMPAVAADPHRRLHRHQRRRAAYFGHPAPALSKEHS